MHILSLLPLAGLLGYALAQSNNDVTTTTINTTLSANRNEPYDCLFPSGGFDPRGAVQDCFQAILKLPQDVTISRFHQQGREDTWKLPQQASRGTCQVTVKLAGNVEDTSSWSQLTNVATTLVLGCGGAAGGSKAGGTFQTGNTGGIKISLGTTGAAVGDLGEVGSQSTLNAAAATGTAGVAVWTS